MATFDDLLARNGGGNGSPTGAPNQPKVPGGGPTPSTPPSFVNPTGVANGPVGRPPLPAGGTGSALPITPGAAAGQPAQAQGQSRQSTQRPPQPGGTAAPTPPNMPGGTGPGIQTSTTATPLVMALDHVPDAAERAGMMPGTQIQTPYGSVDSQGNLIPSPEGAQKYQQAVVTARRSFGPHPWADDPQAPPAPVKLGRKNFNPFLGTWSK